MWTNSEPLQSVPSPSQVPKRQAHHRPYQRRTRYLQ